ncbi:MAG: hypothetical protein LBR36_05495 [Bacteroidales bacterium]|jgi:hypothetical protein|nr:hypothetical protein [Bacteroidales bacterium]
MIFNINEEVVVCKGYQKQFENLLNLVSGKALTQELGEKIKTLALQWAKEIKIEDFMQFYDDRYGRNYLGKDEKSAWEAILMTWKRGICSTIHGHPQYAGYTHVSGEILLEVFEEKDGGIKKVLEHVMQPGESFFAVSDKNDFKNHIHRLTGLTDARTLHIYSDDARKGHNFSDYKVIV